VLRSTQANTALLESIAALSQRLEHAGATLRGYWCR